MVVSECTTESSIKLTKGINPSNILNGRNELQQVNLI
jgi:hypothetical protein